MKLIFDVRQDGDKSKALEWKLTGNETQEVRHRTRETGVRRNQETKDGSHMENKRLRERGDDDLTYQVGEPSEPILKVVIFWHTKILHSFFRLILVTASNFIF